MKMTQKHRKIEANDQAAGNAQRIICDAALAEFEAEAPAADGKKKTTRNFSMMAYTGGAMRLRWWDAPVVIDIAGMDVGGTPRPIYVNHQTYDIDSLLGQTTEIKKTADGIAVRGVAIRSETSKASQRVFELHDAGFKFQASVGAYPTKLEKVEAGQTVKVNGREFTGPVYVARASALSEISFVPLGADDKTSAQIAAAAAVKGNPMSFEQWLEARGFSLGSLSDAQKKSMQAMYEAEIAAAAKPATDPAKPAKNDPAPADTIAAAAGDDAVLDHRKKMAAEAQRIADVTKIAKDFPDIAAKAVGEGWDKTKTELEVIRAERPQKTVGAIVAAGDPVKANVLEAAALMAGGFKEVEKQFDAPTLEAAHKRFRQRATLQELAIEAAWANGYTGRSFRQDPNEVLRYAFRAAGGFSSYSFSGILSNVANKFLLASFLSVEQVYRMFSKSRNVVDFKAITSYRLGADAMYEEVGPGGEIAHGEYSEDSFTNQAKTFAKMFGITRAHWINDDMGALTQTPALLGRGAGLKVNDVFWTQFMDNASFFASGNNNYLEGATPGTNDTRLNIEGLTRAEAKLSTQVDQDGFPLGIIGEYLLTPIALKAQAEQLMNSTEVRDTTSSTNYGTANPHAKKWKPVASTYLSNSNYTGYSAAAWYLLGGSMALPVIEIAYLNGREEPFIESADADFNTLGVQFRGYHDFGVNKQDERGGVKMKGAA